MANPQVRAALALVKWPRAWVFQIIPHVPGSHAHMPKQRQSMFGGLGAHHPHGKANVPRAHQSFTSCDVESCQAINEPPKNADEEYPTKLAALKYLYGSPTTSVGPSCILSTVLSSENDGGQRIWGCNSKCPRLSTLRNITETTVVLFLSLLLDGL